MLRILDDGYMPKLESQVDLLAKVQDSLFVYNIPISKLGSLETKSIPYLVATYLGDHLDQEALLNMCIVFEIQESTPLVLVNHIFLIANKFATSPEDSLSNDISEGIAILEPELQRVVAHTIFVRLLLPLAFPATPDTRFISLCLKLSSYDQFLDSDVNLIESWQVPGMELDFCLGLTSTTPPISAELATKLNAMLIIVQIVMKFNFCDDISSLFPPLDDNFLQTGLEPCSKEMRSAHEGILQKMQVISLDESVVTQDAFITLY